MAGMEAGNPPASSVFVGNLNFDLTEQDVIDFFSQVGPVKSVRIATDRDTGKPRGFGFVEFFDIPTAESAVRNLSGTDLQGRTIRVVFSRDDAPGGPGGGGGPQEYRGRREDDRYGDDRSRQRGSASRKLVGGDLAYHSSHGMAALLGQQPQQGAPPDQITVTLARKTRNELFEYLAQFQYLLNQNPQQAREILVQNPNLTRALFQIEIILGMVRNPLGDVAPKGIAPPGMLPPKHGEDAGAPPSHYAPPASYGGPPPWIQPADTVPMAPVDPRLAAGGAALPVDPRLAGGVPPPQPMQPAYVTSAPRPMVSLAAAQPVVPAAPAAQQKITPEQQALLQQLMTLTPAQIELLPPQQKAQVLALQQQQRAQGR